MNEWRRRRLLLSLILRGEARTVAGAEDEADLLHGLDWVAWAGRRRLRLAEGRQEDVEGRLEKLWPSWREEAGRVLAAGGEPLDEDAYRRLQVAAGAAAFPARWPGVVNRRTVTALLAGSAKAPLSETHVEQAGASQIMVDDVLRLRAFVPLVMEVADHATDIGQVTALWGDCPIPERALVKARWRGAPQAVVTVENKTPFVDLPVIGGVLAVHCPGKNLRLGIGLLGLWNCPVFHFGDFDDDGLAIARRLGEALGERVRWLLPEGIAALAATHGVERRGLRPGVAPGHALLQSLTERRQRLEHEALVLHEAFPRSINALFEQSIDMAEEMEPARGPPEIPSCAAREISPHRKSEPRC